MKLRIAFAFALSVFALAAHAEKIALIGGTVINPADGKITRNATVFVDNGRITNIAANMVMKFGGRTIDCAGKFILPGYIDTHVHFFQSGDLFTRPDGADLNSVRPYKDEVAWVKSHVDDVFVRSAQRHYQCCRCWRTVLEFRSPQGCERDCESAARGGG